MKLRVKRVVILTTLFVVLGLLYALFVSTMHWAIPCVFRVITGLKCPGCGITHAVMNLLRLDWIDAYYENRMIYPIIVFTIWVYLWTTVHYIRTGNVRLGTGCRPIEVAFLISLLLWGIIRNITGV